MIKVSIHFTRKDTGDDRELYLFDGATVSIIGENNKNAYQHCVTRHLI